VAKIEKFDEFKASSSKEEDKEATKGEADNDGEGETVNNDAAKPKQKVVTQDRNDKTKSNERKKKKKKRPLKPRKPSLETGDKDDNDDEKSNQKFNPRDANKRGTKRPMNIKTKDKSLASTNNNKAADIAKKKQKSNAKVTKPRRRNFTSDIGGSS